MCVCHFLVVGPPRQAHNQYPGHFPVYHTGKTVLTIGTFCDDGILIYIIQYFIYKLHVGLVHWKCG